MILSLLDPRVWLLVAAVGAGGYLKGCHDGGEGVRNEWDLAKADANTEARRMEQARQSRADEAARSAVSRQAGLSADAAGAGDVLGRLRDAIAARRLAEESHGAAVKRANAAGQLLIESATAYRELAATCDRHVNDLRLLLEAWPK